MKKYTFLLLLLLISASGFAQIQQLKRVEIEIKDKVGDNFKVFNLGEKGLITFLQSQEFLRHFKKEIVFTKYDTALNTVWQRSYAMDGNATFSQHYQDGDNFYMLLSKANFEYEILKINVNDGLLTFISYEKLLDLDVTHFKAFNDVVFMGGTIQSHPVVLRYDYRSDAKAKVLPAINQLKATLHCIEASREDDKVCVIMSSTNHNKPNLFFNTYDRDGRLISNLALGPEREYSLLTFRPYVVNEKEQLLFGTYSISDNDRAQGVYVAHFVNGNQKSLRFYDFSYLKNFFNYLRPKRKEKVMSKINKKRDEGKIQKHDYNLFVRDLIFQDGKILLLAESYVPVYSENPSAFATAQNWGSHLWNTNPLYYTQMNDLYGRRGRKNPPLTYKYKHAIVCAFDKNGKLLWDNSFEFKELECMNPVSFLEINVKNDRAVMLHLQDQKFYFKKTHKNATVDVIQEQEIFDAKDNGVQRVVERDRETVQNWYGGYFLLYGVQNIRTNNLDDPLRNVFYLTKMVYQEESDKK